MQYNGYPIDPARNNFVWNDKIYIPNSHDECTNNDVQVGAKPVFSKNVFLGNKSCHCRKICAQNKCIPYWESTGHSAIFMILIWFLHP